MEAVAAMEQTVRRLKFLDAFIEAGLRTQPNLTHRAFGELPYGSLSISDRDHVCPDVWGETSQLAKWPSNTKALFILGAQKAGTTWLQSVLRQNPYFVLPRYYETSDGGSQGGEGELRLLKELHAFDGWPLPQRTNESFEAYFPKPSEIGPGQCLLDSTPNYLYTAMAPARIKHILPQAKFIVVLRDPVLREYSSYQMDVRHSCSLAQQQNPGTECTHGPFWKYVAGSIAYQTARGCLFNQPGSTSTWGSCFRCSFTLKRGDVCERASTANPEERPEVCGASRISTINHSNYAAQLAWWFAFFPPDRFLILLSSDLHHKDESVRLGVLNRVKRFAGVAGPEFNASVLERAVKHEGGYQLKNLPLHELRGLLALRLMYRQSLADLTALLRGDGVHTDFPGIREDLPLAVLQSEIEDAELLGQWA